MSDNLNERLEREAREALVASDLSAKMKRWRSDPPPGKGKGGSGLRVLLLLLLALGGTAWWLWPDAAGKLPVRGESPAPPAPALQHQPSEPVPAPQEPIVRQQAPTGKRFLALAETHYRAPDFAGEIRGAAPAGEDVLNTARRALAERRFDDALAALQNVPADYRTDADYLRGHALFGQKKYAQSTAVFEKLTGSVRYGEAAQWYAVLASLPALEQHRAEVLKKIRAIASDEGHTFYREARALEKDL